MFILLQTYRKPCIFFIICKFTKFLNNPSYSPTKFLHDERTAEKSINIPSSHKHNSYFLLHIYFSTFQLIIIFFCLFTAHLKKRQETECGSRGPLSISFCITQMQLLIVMPSYPLSCLLGLRV